MNRIDELDQAPAQHNEITLGTATLLGIFLGLVLVCAVFFGFGYSLGRRSMQASSGPDAATDSANFGSFKPSPGNPAMQPASRADQGASIPQSSVAASRAAAAELAVADAADSSAPERPAVAKAAGAGESAKPAASLPAASDHAGSVPTRAVAAPAAAPSSVASQLAQAASPAMVQIAAVSHQEDADVLVKALKRQGHDVVARQDPTDRLIHVQIGPFATRKDAEAMRQTLLTEGYNAIVK